MNDKVDGAIIDTLRSESGKRVIMWVLEAAGIYADPFAGDGSSEATAYIIGRQSIGRRVISRLNSIDPVLYPQLLFDAATIRAADEREAAKESGDEEENDDA